MHEGVQVYTVQPTWGRFWAVSLLSVRKSSRVSPPALRRLNSVFKESECTNELFLQDEG